MKYWVTTIVLAICISVSMDYYISSNHIFNPERYHGHDATDNYFEGWYYKVVSKEEKDSLVVIAGIIYADVEKSHANHAFIMAVVNGKIPTKYNFKTSEFYAEKSKFVVHIGNNSFSETQLKLNLIPKEGDEADISIIADLNFTSTVPWPVTYTSPGVMGWFSYLPILECYHGVVSMHHYSEGTVEVDYGTKREVVDYHGGKGYTEKDWGTNFPSSWVWVQSNHFRNNPDTSLFLSVASVPWKNWRFPGYLVGFWHNNFLYRFATYTGASFKILKHNKHHIELSISDSEHRLYANITKSDDYVLLWAPMIGGIMEKYVEESVLSEAHIKFYSLKDNQEVLIFEDRGDHAGLEITGDIDWIASNL